MTRDTDGYTATIVGGCVGAAACTAIGVVVGTAAANAMYDPHGGLANIGLVFVPVLFAAGGILGGTAGGAAAGLVVAGQDLVARTAAWAGLFAGGLLTVAALLLRFVGFEAIGGALVVVLMVPLALAGARSVAVESRQPGIDSDRR